MENIIMGVDIGGSHITSQLIDVNGKKEVALSWARSYLDANAGISEIIDSWASTMEQSINSYEIFPERINIAMPGPMDYEKGICKILDQGKYGSLYGVNIKELLAKRLGINGKQISFFNDAECFLKGELFIGSLQHIDHAIGITLGTGLGTSHTLNGKVIDSGLWRMPFLKGKAEDYISTRWFIKRFKELSNLEIDGVKDLIENHHESPYFKAIFLEFSINLAKFLFKFIRSKQPVAAVIGGNIAFAEKYFIENTRKYLSGKMGYIFPVEISSLGEKATLIGAGSSVTT